MPLEVASTISQLDNSYPLASDPGSRGDDHIRLVKAVLKKQFPGKDGNGFSKPITISEDDLNGLVQKITDLNSNMDKRWPVGSILLFVNNRDPNGEYPGTWARIVGDASIGLGDGSNNVGIISGNNDPAVPLVQHSHGATFNGASMPAHSHGITIRVATASPEGKGDWSAYGPGGGSNQQTDVASAGVTTGSVSIHNAGTPGATLNVRGARLTVNVWKRTS